MVVATACQRVEVIMVDRDEVPRLSIHYVTRDGDDRYVLKSGPGAVRASALSTNRGGNTRSVIWAPDTEATQDHQVCTLWTDKTGAWAQQGIALRFRADGARVRTVAVTKNVLYGAEWQMNVVTWDTARLPYLRVHGAVPLREPFELNLAPRPLPWRICAQVVDRVVRVKGWRHDQPEPGWHDPQRSGTVVLPVGWVFTGRAGVYAGHIPGGGTIGMSGIRTSTWVLEGLDDPPASDVGVARPAA